MKKRRSYFASILLLMAVLLTGCQSSTNKDSMQIRQERQKKTILTFFLPMDMQSYAVDVYKNIIAEFNAENNDIEIRVDGISTVAGFNKALEQRLEDGDAGADLFLVNADSVKPLHAKGCFYDLSGIPAYKMLNSAAKEQSVIEGTVYTIPVQMTAYGLYVNTGLLRSHGLEPPENLEQFLHCCQTLKENGITPISCNRGYAFTTIAMARGLYPIYQAENKEELLAGLNDGSIKIGDYMVEGFRLTEELVQKGYYGSGLIKEEVDAIAPGTTDLENFIAGKTAFAVFPMGKEKDIDRGAPDMEYIQQGFPVLPDGTVSLPALSVRICVNAKGSHVAESLIALEYMTTKKADEFMENGVGILPAITGGKPPAIDPRADALYQDVISGGQIPIEDMSLYFTYWDTIRAMCIEIVGGMTPEEAAEEYNRIQMEQIQAYRS